MRTVRVGDIAEQVRGVTFSKSDAADSPRDGYTAVLTASHIQQGELVARGLTYVPSGMVRDRQHVRENDVVVCTSSGSLSVVGKAARSRGDFFGGFGAFLKVLRPNPEVDPGYFAHFFQTQDYRRRVSRLAAGANINNLKNEHLNELVLPLPSLPEQRRIAAILDHADALRAKRRQVLTHLDALTQSIFHGMFGDEDWRHEFGTVIAAGPTNGMYRPASDYGDGTPILRIDGFHAGELLNSSATWRRLRADEVEIRRYGLHRGDIVLNRVNALSHLGKAALIASCDEPSVYESNMMRIRVGADKVERVFVLAWLQTKGAKQQILRKAKKAINQASINQTDVRSLLMPLPSLDRQRQFATRFEHIRADLAATELAATADDELFASLQSRAFRGEL